MLVGLSYFHPCPIFVTHVNLKLTGHNVIVTEDNRCMVFGRNLKGQLGLGDEERRDIPTEVEALKGESIVGASCGRHHTLFLTGKTSSLSVE